MSISPVGCFLVGKVLARSWFKCVLRNQEAPYVSSSGLDDIKVNPVVDPNYLSHPGDLDIYRRGVQFAYEIGKEMSVGYPMKFLDGPVSSAPEDI